MKSARKAQKIILNARLINQLKEKDVEVNKLSQQLDQAHDRINRESKHMIDLVNFLGMDNIEELSMGDVINEVKKQLKGDE